MYRNGSLLQGADYVASNGTSVVIASAVENDEITVVTFDAFTVADTCTKAESDAKIVELAPSEIDDVIISTTSTYSSDKVDSELVLKADQATIYTKTETDANYEPINSTVLKDADIGITVQEALVSSTNIKTIAGTSMLGSGGIPSSAFGGQADFQEFTTSGTWTKPADVNFVYVEVVGGGGGCYFGSSTRRGGNGASGIVRVWAW